MQGETTSGRLAGRRGLRRRRGLGGCCIDGFLCAAGYRDREDKAKNSAVAANAGRFSGILELAPEPASGGCARRTCSAALFWPRMGVSGVSSPRSQGADRCRMRAANSVITTKTGEK